MKITLLVISLILAVPVFAKNVKNVEKIRIENYGFSFSSPEDWEEYNVSGRTKKISNFRFPWMKTSSDELVMFGIASSKGAHKLNLKNGALVDAKSKTFDRGGLLFTGKSNSLASASGTKIFRVEFLYEHGTKKLNRYYIKNKKGVLCWINVCYKSSKSAKKIEQTLLANIHE